jgi:hypothetical protein
MLFYYLYHVKYLCIGMLIVSLFATACAAYAYSINLQRLKDDPEKRDYLPGALIFVFFTWPILLPVSISLFLLRALFYGIFMIVFTTFIIILPRETSEPTWLEEKITKIGDALLKANSFLIRLMLGPWADEPKTI